MDISIDIDNSKGDLVRVALSYYDIETISAVTTDPIMQSLVFYDVTLVRVNGKGMVGYRLLSVISDTLAKILNENETTVLCFYCDDLTEISRNDMSITPQEHRSKLFSAMFERYVKVNKITGLINHRVKIMLDDRPRIAHFICREKYKVAIEALGEIIMNK